MIETERLILRPPTAEDTLALFELYRDPETMRFLTSPPHESAEETQLMLMLEMAGEGAKHWSIIWRESSEMIGLVNYLGATALPGMGYMLRRDFWGQGIVVEACRAALEYGFEEMGLDRVELWIDERNVASRRVANKLGFGLKGRIGQKYQHRDAQHVMLVYGLWAHEWAGKAQTTATTYFHSVEPVLMVHDVGKSAEFYCDKLGFRVTFLYGEPPNHAGVSRSDWTGTGVALQLTQVPTERELSASTYLYINVDSRIDRLYAEYKQNGVEIVEALESMPWGMREFVIRDLNGHVLKFGTQA